jgi:hypothetical protein
MALQAATTESVRYCVTLVVPFFCRCVISIMAMSHQLEAQLVLSHALTLHELYIMGLARAGI